MGDLYALDFDGVICDSVRETAISCVKLRPVVETGYETLLIVRLLLEIKNPSLRTSLVANGLRVEGILESWFDILPVVM
ncbi:hypothetical protein Hanom_Chr15g01392411 [Helianthus anomalus]